MTASFTHIDDLETPSVLIDLDIVEANITRTQARCDELGLSLRPHIKTHKMPEFAKMQVDSGANGIACQKVSEAEIFADAGFDDIQIPYNIVGERKINRLVELAKRCKISVTVDSVAVVDGIAKVAREQNARIAVLIELVTQGRRTGIDITGSIALAKHILAQSDCLDFAGIMAYPVKAETSEMLRDCLQAFKDAGLDVPMVSGGSSGAIHDERAVTELDEVRMGNYIFYDWRGVTVGWAKQENCAMTVRVSVVSANEADRVILDGGSKTLSSDNIDGLYGHIVEYPGATIYKLNEEHAYVDFSDCDSVPAVGDILHIIPVHSCVVTNLHNQVYGVRGDKIEAIYTVSARGQVW